MIFRYDTEKHAVSKPGGGADLTVGACFATGDRVGNPLIGLAGGIAVLDRALTDHEMKALHDSANIGAPKVSSGRSNRLRDSSGTGA